MSEEKEEKGLALWGGVPLDLHLYHLHLKKCERCGRPAESARRQLDDTESRRFFCHECGEAE